MKLGKLYLYLFLAIVILIGGWYIISELIEKGRLEQANADLIQTVEDREKENKKLKAIALLNSTTIAKASETKNILNVYALKLANELEILKHENEEIKKWSINNIPYILAGRLFDIADNENENGLYISASGVINTDKGTEIKVQNDALYNYANDLKSALRSCNVDKEGLHSWYVEAGFILEL